MRRCEGRAAMLSPASRHTLAQQQGEAGRAGCHRAGSRVDEGLERLGEGEGGSFSLQGTPECLRFCRFRAPLSRARPHFSHQVKLA